MTNPVVTQFGFVQASGALASIVDGDAGTGWAPLADTFDAYNQPFESTPGVLNTAASFPCIQFDYGAPIRLGAFLLQTETFATLGPCMLIGSDLPATSPANSAQPGDVILGSYTQEEINRGQVLLTNAATQDIRKRYYRLLQRRNRP